jgi:hypothetical protein
VFGSEQGATKSSEKTRLGMAAVFCFQRVGSISHDCLLDAGSEKEEDAHNGFTGGVQ